MSDVLNSYVVFDPTGRDLESCYVVGRVDRVFWDTENDDGNADGTPRPLLSVVVNGTGERIAITRAAVVIA